MCHCYAYKVPKKAQALYMSSIRPGLRGGGYVEATVAGGLSLPTDNSTGPTSETTARWTWTTGVVGGIVLAYLWISEPQASRGTLRVS